MVDFVVSSVVVVVASVVVVVASVVVVVASVVVVVASVVVVVASVVVVVASVVVVVASVVVSLVDSSVITDASVAFSEVADVPVVSTVLMVSTGFLPKRLLIPEVLSNAHRTPIARTMIPRKVIRPAKPGSFVALGSLRFLDFLTVDTGVMVLLSCCVPVDADGALEFITPLVAATGCFPLGSKGELLGYACVIGLLGVFEVPGLCVGLGASGALA